MNGADICHKVVDCPGLYVDAFRGELLKRTQEEADATFILTHYHGDHYQNLPKDGKYQGPACIHCTPITAELLIHIHQVPKQFVIPHKYGQSFYHICPTKTNTDDDDTTSNKSKKKSTTTMAAKITFYDANHCPGAAIVLIELLSYNPLNPSSINCKNKTTTTTTAVRKDIIHVHTGDMRYHEKMKSYPLLRNAVMNRQIDLIYLDTTYSHPKYNFVPQHTAVQTIVSQVKELLSFSISSSSSKSSSSISRTKNEKCENQNDDEMFKNENYRNNDSNTNNNNTLILLSCYSIGKEKILWDVAQETNQLIYVSEKKYKMLQCIQRGGGRGVGAEEETSSIISNDEDADVDGNKNRDDNHNHIENDNADDDNASHQRLLHDLSFKCTTDPYKSNIHVIPMGLAGEMWPFFRPNFIKCADYVEKLEKEQQRVEEEEKKQGRGAGTRNIRRRYDKVVAFIPTGWANASKWNREHSISKKIVMINENIDEQQQQQQTDKDTSSNHDDRSNSRRPISIEIRLISYSEHSSYTELQNFVQYIKPRKVIPTVYKDDKEYSMIENYFSKYIDKARAKQAFFSSSMMVKTTAAGTATRTEGRSTNNNHGSSSNKRQKITKDVTSLTSTSTPTSSSVEKVRDDKTNQGREEEMINTLVSMGFSRDKVITAIKKQKDKNTNNKNKNGNNINFNLDQLLDILISATGTTAGTAATTTVTTVTPTLVKSTRATIAAATASTTPSKKNKTQDDNGNRTSSTSKSMLITNFFSVTPKK